MKRSNTTAIGFLLAIFIAGTVSGFAWFRLTRLEPRDPLLEKCTAASDARRQIFVCSRTPGCDHEKMRQLQAIAIKVWVNVYKSAIDSGLISPAAWNCIQSLNQRSDVDDLKSDLDELKNKVDDLESEIDSLKDR
jgi:hypothetical protein